MRRKLLWSDFYFRAFVSFTTAFNTTLHFFSSENSFTHSLIHSALRLRNIRSREEGVPRWPSGWDLALTLPWPGFNRGQGTEIPQAARYGQKIKKKLKIQI